MREILFRGKRVENGEWVEGSFCPKNSRNEIPCIIVYNGAMAGFWFEVDPFTVSQYTGLKDKNGEKIFEGDVMKYGDAYGAVYGIVKYGKYESSNVEQIGLYVEWQNENANRWNDWLRPDLLFWLKRNDCKIVSNIHDNPELSEGEVT